MNTERKREHEKQIMQEMIRIYCRGNHHSKGNTLCDECSKLNEYAVMRVDKCPFIETKTFCSACKVHCYKKDEKEMVRKVMRYAGPRMLFHHPILTIQHMMVTLKGKK